METLGVGIFVWGQNKGDELKFQHKILIISLEDTTFNEKDIMKN